MAIMNGMRILIVEDSPTVFQRLKRICVEEGFATIAHATNSVDARWLVARPFDLAIVDVMLTDGATGILVARKLRASQPRCHIILCSSDEYRLTAASMRAVYVQKGIGFPERIREMIRSTMKGHEK
jgi:DNA-binding response OmpR family regulator